MFYIKNIFLIIALISGLSVQFNWLSQATLLIEISQFEAISRIVLGPIMVWLVMKGLDYLINISVSNVESLNHELFQEMYPKGYWVFTITVLGMFGVRFPQPTSLLFYFFLVFGLFGAFINPLKKNIRKSFFHQMNG